MEAEVKYNSQYGIDRYMKKQLIYDVKKKLTFRVWRLGWTSNTIDVCNFSLTDTTTL